MMAPFSTKAWPSTIPTTGSSSASICTLSPIFFFNTSRLHSSTRILELFGKRFDYRNREDLSALLTTANFRNPRLVGSGHIYDIEVYEKDPA